MKTPKQNRTAVGGACSREGEDSSGLKSGQERRGNDEFCSQQAKGTNPQNDL